MAIDAIKSVGQTMSGVNKVNEAEDNVAVRFSDFLSSALDKVNQLESESSKMTEDFALGKTDNIHQVLIASEKASIAVQMTLQIRNKIMDAYNEIMRMPL